MRVNAPVTVIIVRVWRGGAASDQGESPTGAFPRLFSALLARFNGAGNVIQCLHNKCGVAIRLFDTGFEISRHFFWGPKVFGNVVWGCNGLAYHRYVPGMTIELFAIRACRFTEPSFSYSPDVAARISHVFSISPDTGCRMIGCARSMACFFASYSFLIFRVHSYGWSMRRVGTCRQDSCICHDTGKSPFKGSALGPYSNPGFRFAPPWAVFKTPLRGYWLQDYSDVFGI